MPESALQVIWRGGCPMATLNSWAAWMTRYAAYGHNDLIRYLKQHNGLTRGASCRKHVCISLHRSTTVTCGMIAGQAERVPHRVG